ncbi:MAG: hypothetical protein GQ477_04775 [Nanohaloarchaea archaeon]|nr:hypothetical protein [Candidatus Nanohaloarchaea archaeon]
MVYDTRSDESVQMCIVTENKDWMMSFFEEKGVGYSIIDTAYVAGCETYCFLSNNTVRPLCGEFKHNRFIEAYKEVFDIYEAEKFFLLMKNA